MPVTQERPPACRAMSFVPLDARKIAIGNERSIRVRTRTRRLGLERVAATGGTSSRPPAIAGTSGLGSSPVNGTGSPGGVPRASRRRLLPPARALNGAGPRGRHTRNKPATRVYHQKVTDGARRVHEIGHTRAAMARVMGADLGCGERREKEVLRGDRSADIVGGADDRFGVIRAPTPLSARDHRGRVIRSCGRRRCRRGGRRCERS